MAMKKCKECGNDISSRAEKCPHCGVKRKSNLGCGGFLLIVIALAIAADIIGDYKDTSSKTAISLVSEKHKIEQPSDAQRQKVQDALGAEYPVSKVAVVKSTHHPKAYYVGAIFHAEGVGDVSGLWFVGGTKETPKLIFSIDGAAYQFSGMGLASKTKAAAYTFDPEAEVLAKYLKAKMGK